LQIATLPKSRHKFDFGVPGSWLDQAGLLFRMILVSAAPALALVDPEKMP